MWDGETTELPELRKNETTGKFDWYIYNVQQLKFLANFVNQTLTAADEQLILDKNTTKEEIEIVKQNLQKSNEKLSVIRQGKGK